MDIDQRGDIKRLEKERGLVYESMLENKDARELDTEWICYQVIKQRCPEELLARQGWDETAVKRTVVQLIARTVYPLRHIIATHHAGKQRGVRTRGT